MIMFICFQVNLLILEEETYAQDEFLACTQSLLNNYYITILFSFE